MAESKNEHEQVSPETRTQILAAINTAIGEHRQILDAFHEESDRGAILVAASFLEATLEKLLRSALVHDASPRLFVFEGPLGAFSARIDLAYAFGLIHKSTADHLHRVRRIRNACAHSPESVDFNSNSVRDLTNSMWAVEAVLPKEFSTKTGPEQTRAKFLMNVAIIYSQLLMVLKDAQSSKREQLWYAHQIGHEQTNKTLAALENERKENEDRFAQLEAHFAKRDREITEWVDAELRSVAEDAGLSFEEVRKRYDALVSSEAPEK